MKNQLIIEFLSTLYGRDDGIFIRKFQTDYTTLIKESLYITLLFARAGKLNYWPVLELELVVDEIKQGNVKIFEQQIRIYTELLGLFAYQNYTLAFEQLCRAISQPDVNKVMFSRNFTANESCAKAIIIKELLTFKWPKPIATLEKFLTIAFESQDLYILSPYFRARSLFQDFPGFSLLNKLPSAKSYVEQLYTILRRWTGLRQPLIFPVYSLVEDEVIPAIAEPFSVEPSSISEVGLIQYQEMCRSQDEELAMLNLNKEKDQSRFIAEQICMESRLQFLFSFAEAMPLTEKLWLEEMVKSIPILQYSLLQEFSVCRSKTNIYLQEGVLLRLKQHMLMGIIKQDMGDKLSQELPLIPFFIQLFLQTHKELIPACLRFFEKLNNINQRQQGTKHYLTNLSSYLFFHQAVIIQFMMVMGEDALLWFNDLVGVNLHNFFNFLGCFFLLPYKQIEFLQIYFEKKRQEIYAEKKLKSWTDIFINLGLYIKINLDLASQKLYMITDEINLQEILSHDIRWLRRKIMVDFFLELLKELDLTHAQKAALILYESTEIYSCQFFTKLITAKKTLQDSQYKKLFLASLVENITTIPFTRLELSDTVLLSNYNQSVHEYLKQKGIDPISSLNYKKILEFVYAPKEIPEKQKWLEWRSSLQSLSCYLLSLLSDKNKILFRLDDKSKELKNLQTYLKILESNIRKGGNFVLADQHNRSVLRKIKRLLNTDRFLSHEINTELLKLIESCEGLANELSEWGGNYSPVLKSFSDFRIEQWNKKDPRTFLLGNYLGCCLSMTNTQFPAMVARCLDDGVLFHVVIETKTNMPCALIWLYFATDHSDDVYLVGNFIEITPRYTVNPCLRTIILDALLYYTGEMYCADHSAIKAFLINQLTYGSIANTDQLSIHSLINKQLANKIGGAFLVDQTTAAANLQATVLERYSLSSISNTYFHHYSSLSLERKKEFLKIDVPDSQSSESESATTSGAAISFFSKPKMLNTMTISHSI